MRKIRKHICLLCILSILLVSCENQTFITNTKETKVFQMGDKIRLKNLKISVVQTRRLDRSKVPDLQEDDELFLIKCVIKNTSNKKQRLNPISLFKVIDKEGNEYSKEEYSETCGSLEKIIFPGEIIEGEYVVKIKEGKTGLELSIKDRGLEYDAIVRL